MVKEILGLPLLHTLNSNIGRCPIEQKYPVLITKAKTPEEWWNSLNTDDRRFEVADIAFDHYRFSSNYCWDIRPIPFKDLKKSQQEHIKFAFKQRGSQWEAFPLKSIIKQWQK